MPHDGDAVALNDGITINIHSLSVMYRLQNVNSTILFFVLLISFYLGCFLGSESAGFEECSGAVVGDVAEFEGGVPGCSRRRLIASVGAQEFWGV